MMRTTITPVSTKVYLSIPKDYIGKQIEVLLYTTDEVKEAKATKVNTSKLRGTLNLSDEQYKDFQQHVIDIRNEWNRDI